LLPRNKAFLREYSGIMVVNIPVHQLFPGETVAMKCSEGYHQKCQVIPMRVRWPRCRLVVFWGVKLWSPFRGSKHKPEQQQQQQQQQHQQQQQQQQQRSSVSFVLGFQS